MGKNFTFRKPSKTNLDSRGEFFSKEGEGAYIKLSLLGWVFGSIEKKPNSLLNAFLMVFFKAHWNYKIFVKICF